MGATPLNGPENSERKDRALCQQFHTHYQGRGVVGSTSNILNFIKDQTKKSVGRGVAGAGEKLSFVLGTESGMITSIVRAVQEELRANSNQTQVCRDVVVVVVFEKHKTTHVCFRVWRDVWS